MGGGSLEGSPVRPCLPTDGARRLEELRATQPVPEQVL